jgi:hypothetical protein
MVNFSELQPGANFYVISTNGGLQVAVGTVKGKSAPYWPMNNTLNSQLVDLTVNIGGQDRLVPGLPVNLEVAGRDPEIYTGNRETAERIIDEKMEEADKILQNLPYYRKLKQDGPKCKEIINPGYAATVRQAETIQSLQAELAATKGELQGMKDMQAKTLELLEKLSGTPAPAPAPKGGKKDS